jgi:hypothetical protein
MLGGLPKSSARYIVYKEFQRTPLHFHWLALCARFWVKATSNALRSDNTMHTNVLLQEAMKANIQLKLDGSTKCWVSKFLTSLVTVQVISSEQLSRCTCIEDVVALPIT